MCFGLQDILKCDKKRPLFLHVYSLRVSWSKVWGPVRADTECRQQHTTLHVGQLGVLVKGNSANMHTSACPTRYGAPSATMFPGLGQCLFSSCFKKKKKKKGMNGYLSDLCSSKDTCLWRCIHSNCVKYYKLKCLL